MAVAPYDNLKSFINTKPPLVVFMVCLGTFAVVLLTLAYYVKTREMRNPDVSGDWNVFLENFAELEFCITGNSSDTSPTAPPVTARSEVKAKSKVKPTNNPVVGTDTTTRSDVDGFKNYSVSLVLIVRPTQSFLNIHHNVTVLSGTVFGYQLGLKGPAAEEPINITAELSHEWNTMHCVYPYGCESIQIYTCVHFMAASVVFPRSRGPSRCMNLNDTGIEYHARMVPHTKHNAMFTTYWCRSRPTVKVAYKFNPTLTVWLSLHDRSTINLHLMHTSYFLFVMVITLFCYAIIKGRPTKTKVTQTNEKLLSSYA